MLKSAELGRALSKQDYDAALGDLRTALLKAQAELERAKFPVIVLLHGADGTGKTETLNTLHEWLDARALCAPRHTKRRPEEERERPEFWRYWMWLPKAGRIGGIFLGSCSTRSRSSTGCWLAAKLASASSSRSRASTPSSARSRTTAR